MGQAFKLSYDYYEYEKFKAFHESEIRFQDSAEDFAQISLAGSAVEKEPPMLMC
jgi:hypothetical protein